jgi:pantetheine-phosphate adenylyltransferase
LKKYYICATEKNRNMHRTAVFPGSFDPITRGHENVIIRALALFDRIIIGIGENATKNAMFPIETRQAWIEETFREYPTIGVVTYSGLTVDFCRESGAGYIIRGLRTSADFEFERSIGQVNKKLHPEIETVFFLSMPEYTALNSSIVRDIIRHGGDPGIFIPETLNGKVGLTDITPPK